MNKIFGLLSAVGLLFSVVAANWLTSRYGFVPVGFGLASTAGTFAFGFALALRDSTQDLLGRVPMLVVVVVGAVVSYLVADPLVALASTVAFFVAELANFAVYTPIRNRSTLGDKRWAGAVIGSSVVGAVIDTVIFLAIAFGWVAVTIPALLGQLVGKAYATILYLLIGKSVSWFSTSRTPAALKS